MSSDSGQISKLHIVKTIGSGAFGVVYLCETKNKHHYAVKALSTEDPSMPAFIKRVRDEARLLTMINDPEILGVLGLIKIEKMDAILMEYVIGVDLDCAMKSVLNPKAIAEMGAKVAGALSRAHLATNPKTKSPLEVVHRDIKPANIMLTVKGKIKICDFGVARARFEMRESFTNPKDVLGTLDYMAPDYIVTGKVSKSMDVYGLGLCLLECLTGKPFGNPKLKQNEHDRHILKHLNLMPKHAGPMRKTLRKMLDWDPSKRPTARQCQIALISAGDSITGPSYKSWCNANIPNLIKARPKIEDRLNLLGRKVQFTFDQSSEIPQIQALEHEIDEIFKRDRKWGIIIGLIFGLICYLLVFGFNQMQ